jgi:hypothetical protein
VSVSTEEGSDATITNVTATATVTVTAGTVAKVTIPDDYTPVEGQDILVVESGAKVETLRVETEEKVEITVADPENAPKKDIAENVVNPNVVATDSTGAEIELEELTYTLNRIEDGKLVYTDDHGNEVIVPLVFALAAAQDETAGLILNVDFAITPDTTDGGSKALNTAVAASTREGYTLTKIYSTIYSVFEDSEAVTVSDKIPVIEQNLLTGKTAGSLLDDDTVTDSYSSTYKVRVDTAIVHGDVTARFAYTNTIDMSVTGTYVTTDDTTYYTCVAGDVGEDDTVYVTFNEDIELNYLVLVVKDADDMLTFVPMTATSVENVWKADVQNAADMTFTVLDFKFTFVDPLNIKSEIQRIGTTYVSVNPTTSPTV